MESINTDLAVGFAQEIPGGYVFEIGNQWVQRRIHCIAGKIGTTSLVNTYNVEEYLEEPLAEFEITISGEGQQAVLDSKDFKLTGYETPNWDDTCRTLELKLETDLNDKTLSISVFYEAKAGDNFIRKWIEVQPCDLECFAVRGVTLEKMRLKEMIEGIIPLPRYPRTYDNHEDKIHGDADKANTAEPDRRFMNGDLSRAIVRYWGYEEGLFFFTESLLGEEIYHRMTGLVMKQREYAPLTEGLKTGAAVIGGYAGQPELGFKRYNEYLLKHWCVIDDKRTPVSWSTWLVTLEGNRPLMADYDRNLLLEYIEDIKEAGYYDVLHLDLGWEAKYPLQVDRNKFPNGLEEISERAKGAADLDLALWINPFSCNYWKSEVEDENPEYLVPGEVSPRSGATAICPLTGYFDYVKKRLLELVVRYNVRVIYWDGGDWNIRNCTSKHHGHRDFEELEARASKMFAELCREAHEIRPDLMFVVFSLPFNNHRLNAVDQEQISDTSAYPTLQSELIHRQQLYQMTWEHPYRTIWGSWYGINWHLAGEDNLKRRMKELMYAEMSMIGNGAAQAGGGFDFKQASPEFMSFMKKLMAFRKKFEQYFTVYQHVLGFPDGKRIDGEGHIIDGKGFIVLSNPTDTVQSVKIPLDEVELELSATRKYKLSDWSILERGTPMDSVAMDKAPEIELLPLEVKFIGVNIEE